MEAEIVTRPRTNTLKYGLQSPLHDYYHFNCSRQNSNVRKINTELHTYIAFMLIMQLGLEL